jgi:hypothetical protein
VTFAAKAVVGSDGSVIDTNMKLSATEARALFTAGARVAIRYVFFGPARPGDLDAAELTLLTDEGFTVLAVQHPRSPANNTLSALTGGSDAAWAIKNAIEAGYDPAVPQPDGKPPALILDMEGVKGAWSGAVAHAHAWATAVAAAGFRVMVYCGYDCGMTSADCDALPGDPLFWCDAGPYNMRPAPHVGFVLKQHMQSTLAGIGVDKNDVLQDGVVYGVAKAADQNTEPVDTTATA